MINSRDGSGFPLPGKTATAAVNVAVIEQLNQGQILKLSFLLSFK